MLPMKTALMPTKNIRMLEALPSEHELQFEDSLIFNALLSDLKFSNDLFIEQSRNPPSMPRNEKFTKKNFFLKRLRLSMQI